MLTFPQLASAAALGRNGFRPPSERITVGIIGRGLMGAGHVNRMANDRQAQVLGVCDVDQARREQGCRLVNEIYAQARQRENYLGCVAYNDYRELLQRADLDAVLIATPDHWHALQAMDAARAGKDIYCEKPVSLSLSEGREIVKAVRRFGRVFQTGTQYRSIPVIRKICQFVRQGGLGRIKSVFTIWHPLAAFLGDRIKPYARAAAWNELGRLQIPVAVDLPAEPVPAGLDWDLWVGPAPWHPYHPLYHINPPPGVVPWSFHEDFGLASSTWFHSHAADVIQYALGMEESGPVEIHHPADGVFPTLTCRYANGVLLHHVEHYGQVKDLYHAVPADAQLSGLFGGIFVGERGWLTSMSSGGPIDGGPTEIMAELGLHNRQVQPGANDHHANWLECIRNRRQPSAHEEIGHRAAALGQLVIMAWKLGRSLKWDPEKEEFIGDATANRLRHKTYREPWLI
ncbi:MAG: Gfo/Idh/MocA family oxidoreductase [Verrucomicrobiae bacterium]|nr:Gfo/Idh/MocA family oxidoreductase [Verrucomicrobiae bacterium]